MTTTVRSRKDFPDFVPLPVVLFYMEQQDALKAQSDNDAFTPGLYSEKDVEQFFSAVVDEQMKPVWKKLSDERDNGAASIRALAKMLLGIISSLNTPEEWWSEESPTEQRNRIRNAAWKCREAHQELVALTNPRNEQDDAGEPVGPMYGALLDGLSLTPRLAIGASGLEESIAETFRETSPDQALVTLCLHLDRLSKESNYQPLAKRPKTYSSDLTKQAICHFVVKKLHLWFKANYGSPLHNHVATISDVVLYVVGKSDMDQPLDKDRVRDIVNGLRNTPQK